MPAPKAERPLRLFAAGLSLTLGNPKTMVFYLALLPNLIDLAAVTPLAYAELVAVTLAVCTLVDGGYVLLAARARRLFSSPRALRFVNRGAGALMAGAAVAVASPLKQLILLPGDPLLTEAVTGFLCMP